MKKQSVIRGIMVVAGLFAVLAILISPSVSFNSKSKELVKTEKSADQKEVTTISAPTEAIPGSAVKLDEPSAPLISLWETKEVKEPKPLINPDEVVRYLKVLFRTIIASNAP